MYMRLGSLQKDAKKSRDAKSAAKNESSGGHANSVKMYALNAEVRPDNDKFSLRAKPDPEASALLQAVSSKRVRDVFLRGSAFAIEYSGSEAGVLVFELNPSKAESPFLTSAPLSEGMATAGFAKIYIMAT